MQKFRYRTPRYAVDLPVSVTLQGTTFPGRCREISLEGMRLEVDEVLRENATGSVSLAHRHISVEVPVRVKYTGARQDGLRFLFDSERQRAMVAELVELLSEPPAPCRPVLVK